MIEARDVCAYLKALEPHFEDIQDTDFKDIQPKLKSLLHCVCLIWSNSKYYCVPTRIITLLSEISNLLITEVRKKNILRNQSILCITTESLVYIFRESNIIISLTLKQRKY